MNQLQAVAMNEGYRWKKKLFSQQGRALLEKLPLAPWASRRRKELLELLDQLDPKIEELTAAVEQEAKKRPEVLRLMTHPGVGPITGLAYVLVIGTPDRFPCGKQIGSYTGTHSVRGLQCRQATTGTHQQAGQYIAALLAGGSIASSGAVEPRLATSVYAPGDASAKEHCQSGDGQKTRVFGCTGCGEMIGTIRSWSDSVRTRESSVPDMA